MIARFGVRTYKRIARDIGLTESAVAQRRNAPGIPRSPATALEPRQWSPEDGRLLGTMPDRDMAQELGVPVAAVERRRVQFDLDAFRPGGRRSRTSWSPDGHRLPAWGDTPSWARRSCMVSSADCRSFA